MRLSRSAWNNVIIFSVMGFILLINLTQRGNNEETSSTSLQEQSVIGEGRVILTMTIGQQVTIERVGQSWRMVPERLAVQATEQMMRSWHDLSAMPIDVVIDRQQNEGVFVSMVVAGQQNIQLFTLYLVEQQLVVLNHQTGVYFALPSVMYNQLVPSGLLVE